MAGTRKTGMSEREGACVPAGGWRSVHARTWTRPKLPTVDLATDQQGTVMHPPAPAAWLSGPLQRPSSACPPSQQQIDLVNSLEGGRENPSLTPPPITKVKSGWKPKDSFLYLISID